MLNTVTIMGRLTADPDLGQTPNNISVCKFTVAVEDDIPDKNGNRAVQFISVIAWRQTAEFAARNFTKGKLIVVQGRLKNNNYEKENIKHYGMQIEVSHIYFAGDKSSKPTASPVQQDLPEELSEYEMLTDEEPF